MIAECADVLVPGAGHLQAGGQKCLLFVRTAAFPSIRMGASRQSSSGVRSLAQARMCSVRQPAKRRASERVGVLEGRSPSMRWSRASSQNSSRMRSVAIGFVHCLSDDVDARWLPQLFERGSRMLRTTVVHSDHAIPRRVLTPGCTALRAS